MEQEDKDLLLTDLCGRLPYGLKLQNINDKDSISLMLVKIKFI